MTIRSGAAPLVSVAKVTQALTSGSGAGGNAPNALPGAMQWGQANSCTFRFDPQALPRRTVAAGVLPTSRRGPLLSARQAGDARSANRSGGGRSAVLSLAADAGFDYDYDDESFDASVAGTSSSRGADSQGQAEQNDRDAQEGGHGHGNSAHKTALFEFAPSAPLEVRTASSFENDSSPLQGLLQFASALTSDGSSRSLRQRALAVPGMFTSVPTKCLTNVLGLVRAALVEAVDSGALVPKAEASSPDQNCLLPLLLLRALRPMPPAPRAQAYARAVAIVSMGGRIQARPANARNSIAAP